MKVGDYVRTENGIDKVGGYRREPEYENGHVVWFKKSDSGCRFTDKDLPKSSPNITDLIEVGDFINNSKVIKIEKYNNEKYIYVEEMQFCNACNEDENVYYKEEAIKSIVTKEQFESMEYKVGD